MKKLFLSIFALCVFVGAEANERIIDKRELPREATMFLNANFAKSHISIITSEREGLGKEYKVMLENGTKIDFDNAGQWKEIECKRGESVPMAVVPQNIAKQVKARFPKSKIKQIDRSKRETEVELDNGMELKFNRSGALIGVD